MAMKFARYTSQGINPTTQKSRLLGDGRYVGNGTTEKGFICGWKYDAQDNAVINKDDVGKTWMVLSIIISNTCDDEIFVNLYIRNAQDTEKNNTVLVDPTFIAHQIPVPSGSTTIFGSEMKLILQQGDKVYAEVLDGGNTTTVTSKDTKYQCDVTMNIVEMS